MIFIGKAPYRISLLGGGSDLNWFVNKENYGICFGYSLRKYSYSVLNILPSSASKGILEYSTREEYFSISDIVHPIVREVLKHLKISTFIELKTFGFASGGAGLGGSSSFLLSLLCSLSKGFNLGLSNIDINKVHYVDETGSDNKTVTTHGWFDQYLCPNLEPGDYVIMDNASFHKGEDIIEIAEKHQINIIYLPAYSPDLNPIEKFWANFKRNLRKVIKKYRSFQDAITIALRETISG